MKKAFLAIVLMLALLVFSLALSTQVNAQNLPPGDFVKTCKNSTVLGPILTAQCQKRNGEWAATKIDHRHCEYIVNDNGSLKCDRWQPARLPKGSYKETCKDIRLDGKYLKADCRRKDGGWRDSEINWKNCNHNIVNDNGRLTCGGGKSSLPKGSYKQTCRNIRVDGKQLKAECKKVGGGWRDTDINWKNCDGTIYNDNGRLRCK